MSCKLQVYNSTIHHLYSALCAPCPESSLLLSACVWPALPSSAFLHPLWYPPHRCLCLWACLFCFFVCQPPYSLLHLEGWLPGGPFSPVFHAYNLQGCHWWRYVNLVSLFAEKGKVVDGRRNFLENQISFLAPEVTNHLLKDELRKTLSHIQNWQFSQDCYPHRKISELQARTLTLCSSSQMGCLTVRHSDNFFHPMTASAVEVTVCLRGTTCGCLMYAAEGDVTVFLRLSYVTG